MSKPTKPKREPSKLELFDATYSYWPGMPWPGDRRVSRPKRRSKP